MKIFAHRGSTLIWPENTLLAFRKAHESGATGFETDLRLSADEVIICAHDDNLARFGWPDRTVSLLPAAEIRKIEISSLDRKFSDTIIDLRTLLQHFPDLDYIFDLKTSDELLVQKLHALLSELQMHDRIWFLTWSRKADNLLAKHFPGYHYFPRMQPSRRWAWASLLRLGRMFEPEHAILSLPAYHCNLPLFTKNQVASIHNRGKQFLGYLINTRKEYERCKVCGVDMVLTDRPDLISRWSGMPDDETGKRNRNRNLKIF